MSKGGQVRCVVLFLAVTLGLNGCTTMRLVPGTADTAMPSDVEVGKRIRVLDSGGVSTDFEVTALGADYVEGRTKDHRIVRFALEDVRQVSERRPAPGRTALLTLGVLYAVGFVVIIESGALTLGL